MYIVVLAFIFLASTLVWYLLHHDHGRQLPIGSLWTAFGFGLLAVLIAYLLELPFPKNLFNASQVINLPLKLVLFLAIGLIEEAAKFLPLALFIYKKPYFKEHTDGVIYFAICGLTFGLTENILYTIGYGSKVGLARLVLTPFLHAATASILGYYLVSYKIKHSSKNKLILACLAIPFLHGFYDFGLSSNSNFFIVVSLMITILLTLGLFLYFMEANELDRAVLAAVPIDPTNFCTSCGSKNSNQTAYCEHCGSRL